MKALSKNKQDRYQDVADFRRDIELFLEGRSVSAKEDTKTEMIWKFVKRNKGFSAGVSLAFLVLLASSWFLFGAYSKTQAAYDELHAEQIKKREAMERSVATQVAP